MNACTLQATLFSFQFCVRVFTNFYDERFRTLYTNMIHVSIASNFIHVCVWEVLNVCGCGSVRVCVCQLFQFCLNTYMCMIWLHLYALECTRARDERVGESWTHARVPRGYQLTWLFASPMRPIRHRLFRLPYEYVHKKNACTNIQLFDKCFALSIPLPLSLPLCLWAGCGAESENQSSTGGCVLDYTVVEEGCFCLFFHAVKMRHVECCVRWHNIGGYLILCGYMIFFVWVCVCVWFVGIYI